MSVSVLVGRDARVMGLIGVAHGSSHYYQLAFVTMLLIVRDRVGLSFEQVGFLGALFYAVSGFGQTAAGFAVDRFGARPILAGGLLALGCAMGSMAVAHSFAQFAAIAVLGGLGNSVFHPADFAILNASITPRRLGYAYSTHGVGGNLGYALAPIVSYGLGATFGWRIALVVMGLCGLVFLGVLATQRRSLSSDRAHDAHTHTLRGSVGLFVQPAIFLCFLYFIFQTIASIGLQTFLPAALNTGFDVPLVVATSAMTAYLLGGAAGIVAGGFLAVRTSRHDRVATAGLLAGALLLALLATGLVPHPWIVPLFIGVGIVLGATGPSRDLIVRNATPAGAAGRVYGFVYSGLDIGSMLGPVWFGLMLDHGLARQMFYVIAFLLLVAIGTVLNVRRATVAPA